MLAFRPLEIVFGKWSAVTKRLSVTYFGEEGDAGHGVMGQGRRLPGRCLESRVLTRVV